ncbi:restriction endonuclease subunit S [Limosilactobacillus mucosae]|uniref:restriction endonuclease subunit S n=1 Tax=Limosilactobacillus mucosae TaxID=97478 RepID=UPI0022E910A6|nr:restriction endonuclease subunit S [Limosilactobacillus mucosae]
MGFKIGWLTWEQRKLENMVHFFNGLTYKPNDIRKSGTFVIRSSNIQNGAIVSSDDVFVRNEIANSTNVKIGDIIVVVRNGSRKLIGKHAIVTVPMNNTVIGAFMTGIRTEHYNFINALLSTLKFKDELRKNMGATINQITGYMFSNMKFMFPNDQEMDRIGTFLRKLDNLITLQQRKLDQLNTLKKGLLQKMFADKKHPKPELRFKGFSDDWEQCKFEQILISHPYKKYLASPSTNGKYKVIQQGDNPVVGWASGNPFMQYEGATLFGDHTLSLYKPTAPFFVATDGLKILTGKNIKGYYLFTLLEKNKPKSQGYKRHFNILKNEKVVITKNPEEQQQMGCLFKQVDKTITLQQSKLDKLNSLKKSLLQTMFI